MGRLRDRTTAAEAGDLLVTGAAEIVTMAGGLRRGRSQGDVALLTAAGGALAIWVHRGRIEKVGLESDVRFAISAAGVGTDTMPNLDAGGRTVTPGLIDPHTHLLFGGTREPELALRQSGAGYLEILASGGGILATVQATRAATSDALLEHGRRWAAEMLSHGVTTAEVKSGYGLDTETELRLLDVYAQLAEDGSLELVPSFLGAHAVPRELATRPDATEAYVQDVIDRQLPAVAKQGVARFCDIFCERGVFDAAQSRRVLAAGAALGLRPRLHADEIHDSGGAALAADLGAASADHLAAISEAGIDALGSAADRGAAVVATLLPVTTLYLGSEHYAPARALIERGVPVALGSDFNPGTSPTPNLALVMSIARVKLGLSASEALAATTVNAAHAVGLGATHGAIEAGRVGDLVVWDAPRHELVPYWIGANLVRSVVKNGRVVRGV
ncbi:MAG: imidazolonepropionase [Candidatus Limnocylindrales bacterium]